MTIEKLISFTTSQYMIYILSIGWTIHVMLLNRSNKKINTRCEKLQRENAVMLQQVNDYANKLKKLEVNENV